MIFAFYYCQLIILGIALHKHFLFNRNINLKGITITNALRILLLPMDSYP